MAGLGCDLGHRDWSQVGDERVQNGVRCTNNELGNLHGGETSLDNYGNPDREGRQSVVGVHESMDERIDQSEDPNRSRHVAHASPHAQHGASVMIGLQSRTELALGENDERVQDLVEFAQVEDPAVVVEALVPDASHLGVAWLAALKATDKSCWICAVPASRRFVEVKGAAQTRRAMDPAQAICRGGNTSRPKGACDAASHGAQHAPKSPC